MSSGKRDFGAAAETWDENPARVKLAHDVFRAIADTRLLSPAMDVLEVGCGTGLLTLLLRPEVNRINAIDSAEAMLAVLKRKIKEGHIGNVTTGLADLETGGGFDGRYDMVVSSMTLHHICDIPALLGHCAAVLKPKGLLCIADLDADGGKFHDDSTGVFHNGFDRCILKKQFEAAGFGNIRNRTAAIIHKPDSCGDLRCFTVFLMTGRKRNPA
jgi:ubiquinone/menaquinone biosynthesis C-methylase UbiE